MPVQNLQGSSNLDSTISFFVDNCIVQFSTMTSNTIIIQQISVLATAQVHNTISQFMRSWQDIGIKLEPESFPILSQSPRKFDFFAEHTNPQNFGRTIPVSQMNFLELCSKPSLPAILAPNPADQKLLGISEDLDSLIVQIQDIRTELLNVSIPPSNAPNSLQHILNCSLSNIFNDD